MKRLALALVIVCAVGGEARAVDGETDHLIYAGLGMAVPTYFIGVALHEGSHAFWANTFGAEVLELKLLPAVIDGQFYFGYTRWRGHLTPGQYSWVLLSPKAIDLLLLGGYTLLVGLDALPDDDYAALALTVFATGAWVDFSKDIFSWLPANDLMKIHLMRGRTREWQRLPYRALHLGLSVGAGYFLAKGYIEIFRKEDDAGAAPVIFQVFSTRF